MKVEIYIEGVLEEDAALQAVLAALAGAKATGAAATGEPGPRGKRPAARPAPKTEPEPETKTEPEPVPGVTFETLRKAASDALNRGKREEFAALLAGRGAAKLTEVPEDDRAALLAEIEAL